MREWRGESGHRVLAGKDILSVSSPLNRQSVEGLILRVRSTPVVGSYILYFTTSLGEEKSEFFSTHVIDMSFYPGERLI